MLTAGAGSMVGTEVGTGGGQGTRQGVGQGWVGTKRTHTPHESSNESVVGVVYGQSDLVGVVCGQSEHRTW